MLSSPGWSGIYNSPALAFHGDGIAAMSHHAQLEKGMLLEKSGRWHPKSMVRKSQKMQVAPTEAGARVLEGEDKVTTKAQKRHK